MAWIELHQSVWDHRKTLTLAAELDLEDIYAAAHIIHLWTWALDNAPEGDLTGLMPRVIAIGAGWRNNPDQFVEAVIKAGWIDRVGDSLFIHDWEEYAGKLMDRRASERERSRQRRAAAKRPVSNQQETTGRPPDDHRTTVGTVPNRTVKDNNNNDHPAPARTEIFSTFEKEFGRPLSPLEYEQITQWEKDFSAELILEALKRAVLGGKRNFKYINSILLEWKKNTIRTVQEVQEHDEAFEKRKSQARTRDGPKSGQARAPDPAEDRQREFTRGLYNKGACAAET